LDAPATYTVIAGVEEYESGAQEVTVQSGETVSDVNFVLGLQEAYVTDWIGELPGPWWTFPLAKAPYSPLTDSHQWMVHRAVGILKEERPSIYNQLCHRDDFFPLWFWIARGARRADFPELDSYISWYEPGYGKEKRDHFHHYKSHKGETNLSAAWWAEYDFFRAQLEWGDALAFGGTYPSARAMYLLGIALHHVQDLRVPQHNINAPLISAITMSHVTYENWCLQNQVFMKSEKGIYQESFSKKKYWDGERYHQDSNEARGWVDRSAHISIRYLSYATDTVNFETTIPLFKSTQGFSAGFIKFFFDKGPRGLM